MEIIFPLEKSKLKKEQCFEIDKNCELGNCENTDSSTQFNRVPCKCTQNCSWPSGVSNGDYITKSRIIDNRCERMAHKVLKNNPMNGSKLINITCL